MSSLHNLQLYALWGCKRAPNFLNNAHPTFLDNKITCFSSTKDGILNLHCSGGSRPSGKGGEGVGVGERISRHWDKGAGLVSIKITKYSLQSKPRNPYQSDGKNDCSSTVTSVVFFVAFLYSSTATSFAFCTNNDTDILHCYFLHTFNSLNHNYLVNFV